MWEPSHNLFPVILLCCCFSFCCLFLFGDSSSFFHFFLFCFNLTSLNFLQSYSCFSVSFKHPFLLLFPFVLPFLRELMQQTRARRQRRVWGRLTPPRGLQIPRHQAVRSRKLLSNVYITYIHLKVSTCAHKLSRHPISYLTFEVMTEIYVICCCLSERKTVTIHQNKGHLYEGCVTVRKPTSEVLKCNLFLFFYNK